MNIKNHTPIDKQKLQEIRSEYQEYFNRHTSNDNFKLVPSVFVFVWFVMISMYIGLIYTAIHFIMKFW